MKKNLNYTRTKKNIIFSITFRKLLIRKGSVFLKCWLNRVCFLLKGKICFNIFRALSSQQGTPDVHQVSHYASDDSLLDEDSVHGGHAEGEKRKSTKRRLTGN